MLIIFLKFCANTIQLTIYNSANVIKQNLMFYHILFKANEKKSTAYIFLCILFIDTDNALKGSDAIHIF